MPDELDPKVIGWFDTLIDQGYITQRKDCNIMLSHVNPVSVVVTPSFEVYNSYGDQQIWEAN